MLSEKQLKTVLKLQEGEITEKEIYIRIAKYIKKEEDKSALLNIAEEEQLHYDIWRKYSKVHVKSNLLLVFFYTFLARMLGYTFVIKRMETKQNHFNFNASAITKLKPEIPEISQIMAQELVHEQTLIALLDEELLHFVGSMVLGLNDALVEFTGSLAGYSFAMGSNRLITLAGLITGISATLSMASSEFMSARTEGNEEAVKSALFTGAAYLITVVLLILPFMLLPDKSYGLALIIMLVIAILIIAAFNFYISTAKDLNFKSRFLEMSAISLGVAFISFLLGIVVKKALGINF